MLDRINNYVAGHCGKQLRPMLTLLTAKALGSGCDKNVVRIAAASEMLHNATLIHDDVADGSLLRRGVPTAMAKYGADSAVLVGDFWLSRAIDMVIDHPDRRVLKKFGNCLKELAEGEIHQIEKAARLDTTLEDYFEIIRRKTASLFDVAMVSAAYSVGASESDTQAIASYALHYGRAFQIMDDIFDYSPGLSTGKPYGQDIAEKKITLPLLGFIANAPKKVSRDFLKKVKERCPNRSGMTCVIPSLVADGPNTSPPTCSGVSEISKEAIELVHQYGGIEYAKGFLEKESQAAINALTTLPDSEAKDYLKALAAASRAS